MPSNVATLEKGAGRREKEEGTIPAPFSVLPSPAAAGGTPACGHCGAPLIDDRMRASGFCCAGCSYVFRLIHESGLEGYYRIKDEVTTPADAAVFQSRNYDWLDAAVTAAEQGGAVAPTLELSIQGISCVGCVWLIERVFQQQPGARSIVVNAQYGTMHLRWSRGEFAAAAFARKLQGLGYLVGPPGETQAPPESRGLVKRIGLCAALAMNVMLFSLPAYFGMGPDFEWAPLFGILNAVFGTLSVLVGGSYFIGRAVRALRERALHIDLPISLGILGAYAGSLYGWVAGHERFIYFDFVSAFILLMLVGRWAQVAAVERNQRRLLAQQPKPQGVRLADGREVAPEQIRAGDLFDVAPGQTVPVEARVETAASQFSLASINGEAEPRVFAGGQRIPAGAVNIGRESVRVAALQAWNESLLAQLLAPGDRPAGRHVLLERIVRGYLVGILAIAAGSGFAWWLLTSDAVRTGSVVTAVLVVSCPCAIALAFPLADEMATIALRRRGVFVRQTDLWPKLARVRTMVFDKTGTLTLETPVLQNPEACDTLAPADRDALAALVQANPHPISECLRQHLLVGGAIATPGTAEIEETIGGGVACGAWSLGRAGWRDNEPNDGATVFARDGRVLARFHFADEPRADVRSELARLQLRGLSSVILSGDRQEKVDALGTALGLPRDRAIGNLSPAAKAQWIDAHGAAEAMMLGDGANDSLAFDRALCRGTPVIHRGVLERKADFYYLGRGIGGLRALFEVDALRRRTHRLILVFSIAYNLLAVGLAVAGRMSPLVAAALMPINSLLTLAIVLAGMRRAWQRPDSSPATSLGPIWPAGRETGRFASDPTA